MSYNHATRVTQQSTLEARLALRDIESALYWLEVVIIRFLYDAQAVA